MRRRSESCWIFSSGLFLRHNSWIINVPPSPSLPSRYLALWCNAKREHTAPLMTTIDCDLGEPAWLHEKTIIERVSIASKESWIHFFPFSPQCQSRNFLKEIMIFFALYGFHVLAKNCTVRSRARGYKKYIQEGDLWPNTLLNVHLVNLCFASRVYQTLLKMWTRL